MEFSLRFQDNGKAHNDLVLRIGDQSWMCDTYYFALDRGLLPDREDADKVRVVLRQLLQQWLSAVEHVPDGHTVFLPYDFSDQCTGWLRCQRSGSLAVVCRGWASVEGWSFYPSAIGEHLHRLPGFRPDAPVVEMAVTEFVKAIRDSMADTADPDT
jgi:hypothetical protein